MELEITDSEAKVLKDYSIEFNKTVKSGHFNTDVVALVQSWQNYFIALCVKYNQNPFDMEVDTNTKKWGPRTDNHKKKNNINYK